MSEHQLSWKAVGSGIAAATVFAISTSVGTALYVAERSFDTLDAKMASMHRRLDDLKAYVDNEDSSLIEMDRALQSRLNAYSVGKLPIEPDDRGDDAGQEDSQD